MLTDELKDALVKHMNAEFESYYTYLSMSGYFEAESWDGFAHWMSLQAEEEREHAMRFWNHLIQRGINPQLLQIQGPRNDWENPLDAFEDALKQEKSITKKIDNLMNLAVEASDHGIQNLLRWFIDEQIEEEATVGAIVDRLRRVENDPKGLMLIDTDLKRRSHTEM